MQKRITDDLHNLLQILPPSVGQAVLAANRTEDLLEVILDLGRKPTARYIDGEVELTDVEITHDDLTFAVARVGDFDVRVRVAGLAGSDLWAKAGLMARESLTGASRYAAAFATPGLSGAFFQYRLAAGGGTTNAGAAPVTYPNTWLRLKRAGNNFTGYAGFDGQNWTALGSATLYSLYLVLTRKLSGDEDSLSLLFHANAIGAIALTVAAPATARMPDGWAEWLILPSLGVFGTLGHWFMIKAYSHADASTLAPFMYVQLLVATFYGWLIYDNLPDGFTLLGMLVILSSGLYVLNDGRRAARQARADEVASTPE